MDHSLGTYLVVLHGLTLKEDATCTQALARLPGASESQIQANILAQILNG